MNNPIPLEYLTSFSQTSQAMMQQLATGLLTSGDNASNFTLQRTRLGPAELLATDGRVVGEQRLRFPPHAAGQGRSAVRKHDDTELCDACERSSDWSVGGP